MDEKTYDAIHNEGGEGYNPYRADREKREWEADQEAARERAATPQGRIDALHRRIRTECGSVAREWGDEDKIDALRKDLRGQIKTIETEMDAEFLTEWKIETTKARRVEWNDFIRSIMDSNGKMSPDASRAMYKRQHDQGWKLDDLRKAVKLNNL